MGARPDSRKSTSQGNSKCSVQIVWLSFLARCADNRGRREASSVRSLIGIITTIATVIHFTFGCCLHPCHVGGRGECFAHESDAAACEACCHDQEDAASEPGDPQCGTAFVSLATTLYSDGCHGCDGCHCAATATEAVTSVPWSSLAFGSVAAHDSETFAVFAVTCARQTPDPHVRPCPSRHALFERFLI